MKTRMIRLFTLLSLFAFQQTAFADNDRFIKVDPGERNKICMVNDFYNPMADFSNFSVIVDGKTYYGCCHGCKKALSASNQYHFAYYTVDNKQIKVNKAAAGCILADKKKHGAAYYFNSDQECSDFVKNPAAYTFTKAPEHH